MMQVDHYIDSVPLEPLQRAAILRHLPRLDVGVVDEGIRFVLGKIDRNLPRFTGRFPAPSSTRGVYDAIDNVEWTSGFWTGMLWLAYEVTGEPRYRQPAEVQVASFQRRVRERINVDHHDLGFLYTLSCVSAFKLTGNLLAREAALEAASLLLDRFLPSAGIVQAWGDLSDPAQRGRMIIDCNLNLPLLYWASEVSGDAKFSQAADRHLESAARYLVRPDASTFHTFYMDAETGAPVRGSTHQGYSDDSCWSRGQAWGIYGFSLGFRYRREAGLLRLSQRLANYFLNRLPADSICYWDLNFNSGAEPRDSSAAAIAACGLLDLADSLPANDASREDYAAAAGEMVRELTLHYRTAENSTESGILRHAVYHWPNNIGVDESCIWGDYFFLEALVRLSRRWNPYW